ncbi:helix-turn-helix domain-containing protein [Brochothrix campestris]|uniref:Mga helix-turn-helix domain-containing protein n=1 Tax=Brochothrix campestris FSL F6-1037 TaxID=1265861 RepID=W7CLY3_9LIST|nr:helix-turn-helix domain-containing protein [Brochothrix campestris]EUJ37645.1 mga helix-turn-helix domain-containing protein [Brochothrix campestris FSL F6-1037]
MRTLLNNNSLRRLKFMELLYNTKDWLTLKQIATDIDCSERVLRVDISHINETYMPFSIVTSQKKGVKLEYPTNYSLEFVFQQILTDSIEFTVLEKILLDESFDIIDLANTLYTSPSTLNRIINKNNKLLLERDIKIHTQPCYIGGNELNIRNLLSQFLLEKYGAYNSPFTTHQIQTVDYLYEMMCETVNETPAMQDRLRLRYWFMASIIRINNGHHLTLESNEVPQEVKQLYQNEQLQIAFTFLLDCEFTPTILMELLVIFADINYFSNTSALKTHLKQTTTDNLLARNIYTFLTNLSENTHIPLTNIDEVALQLYNKHYLLVGPNYIIYNRKALFAKRIREVYPFFVASVQQELSKLSSAQDFYYKDYAVNEILYTLLIHWENFITLLEKALPPLTVGLYSDFDNAHSRFVEGILHYYFGKHLQFVHIQDISDIPDISLLITTISSLNFLEMPVICIDPLPSPKNLLEIQQALQSFNDRPNYLASKYFL